MLSGIEARWDEWNLGDIGRTAYALSKLRWA